MTIAAGAAPNVATGTTSIFPKQTLVLPVDHLSSLANSQTIKVNIPHSFRVESVRFRVQTAVTTASKAATLTAQIGGTAMAGGVISLTSAACTPVGAAVAGTTITGTNTGSADTTLEFAVSSVTAFVEGGGWIEVTLTNTESIQ